VVYWIGDVTRNDDRNQMKVGAGVAGICINVIAVQRVIHCHARSMTGGLPPEHDQYASLHHVDTLCVAAAAPPLRSVSGHLLQCLISLGILVPKIRADVSLVLPRKTENLQVQGCLSGILFKANAQSVLLADI